MRALKVMKGSATAVVALAMAVGCNVSVNPGTGTTAIKEPSTVGSFKSAGHARLDYPTRLAQSGKLTFVSDPKANVVFLYDGGVATGTLADLDIPLGIAASGDLLYVGNAGRNDVEVYSVSMKKYLRSLGGEGRFVHPNAIAVASDGTVYVVDSKADMVSIFAADGTEKGTFGGTGSEPGKFSFPISVAVNDSRVFVADRNNHRVQIFDRAGNLVGTFGSAVAASAMQLSDFNGHFTSISSVRLDGEALLVVDAVHAYVQRFDLNGTYQSTFGQAGDCGKCTRMPLDVMVDATGAVLAADPEHHRLTFLSQEVR